MVMTDPKEIAKVRKKKLQAYRDALWSALGKMPMGYPGAGDDRMKYTLELEKIIDAVDKALTE